MKILVINGSPKSKYSTTLQTVLYWQKLYKEHDFQILHVGQKIKYYEKNLPEIIEAVKSAELILFAYPVYTFLATYQLQRCIELLKDNDVDLKGKFATQFTTSKHFYDVTAHNFVKENAKDLGLKYITGLSADMEDLLSKKGRQEAQSFFEYLCHCVKNDIYDLIPPIQTRVEKKVYQPSNQEVKLKKNADVVILTNAKDDINLLNMIEDFRNAFEYKTRIVNIADFEFGGGCLGCFECSTSGKCIYKDKFEDFLRNNIQFADAIVYAYTIKNHYADAVFKMYDDRQFCNGHRAVTAGMPVGYIISGDYSKEDNLRMVVEARSEVGGNFLAGVASDEFDTKASILALASSLKYAYENKMQRPSSFYGVGGTKIFRDLIYVMRGLMKADHKFYKKHGVYDFPQKQRGKMLQMLFLGNIMAIPSVKKKMRGKMSSYIVAPYQKVIENAENELRTNGEE